ncbi:universal stress protein [Halomarina rubra]|uniref:Universal stress protein n=1 Tax=Halomarina rubra TaxID=2071873 RepID=A0ABD6AXL4_9EURY|nr:universal stress protein [Halomarina rubra]
MYDSVLIPTDGSTVATVAAEAAISLADQFDAELHTLSVYDPEDFPEGEEKNADDADTDPGPAAVAAVERRATAADLVTTTAVVEQTGDVHDHIVSYATDHDIGCIVMGTAGRTGLRRFILGSVTEQTLRASPVPVFTVHEDTSIDDWFGSVLVPLDGSEDAEMALDHAIELSLTTGAELSVVHVVDIGVVWGDVDVGMVLDALAQTGHRIIDQAVDRAESAGVSSVDGLVLEGTPYRGILDCADDQHVDAIVMGTHGRTGLDRYLLGSVAERVVRLSTVPVLTLNDGHEDD